MQPAPCIDGIAASQLVSGALEGALVSALRRKGIFTDAEITETYREAPTPMEINQRSKLRSRCRLVQ